MITKRWIDGITATPEDRARIDAITDARGWMPLNWELTRVLVAERDGKLAGFIVCQLMPHTEPMFVAPSERGNGLAEELADDMVQYLQEVRARGWIVIPESQFAARIAKSHGMVKVEAPVYVYMGGASSEAS